MGIPRAAAQAGAASSSDALPLPMPKPVAGSSVNTSTAGTASVDHATTGVHLGNQLRVSALAHGSLLPVFRAMHEGRSGEALDAELRQLCCAMGMQRTKYGGRRALEAALACRLWPRRFACVADAVRHYGCTVQTAKVHSAKIRKMMAGIPDGGVNWL